MADADGDANGAGGDTDASDEWADTVPYQLETPRELWYEWSDTVPRSETLNVRLVSLIRHDLQRHDSDANADGDGTPDMAVVGTRMRIRALSALQVLDDDPETAREHLREIRELASVLANSTPE